MGMTIGEKIIARAAKVDQVKAGEIHTIEVDRLMSNDGTTHLPCRLKRIVSGTNTQDCPVTIAYKKSVHPIPVPNAPKAPYVHVWESAPMINSPGHT